VRVVSERDLFSCNGSTWCTWRAPSAMRHGWTALVSLRGEISQLVERMLAHGASSTQITQIITLLNDHTVCRVIELALAERGDPGVPFSWLCFGSEGRREQTLHTDQDNGILFEAATAPRPTPSAHACCRWRSTSTSAWPSAASPCARATSWPATPSCACRAASGRGALPALSAKPARRTCWVRASTSTCGGVGR
jgi:CBS domain-containing protein